SAAFQRLSSREAGPMETENALSVLADAYGVFAAALQRPIQPGEVYASCLSAFEELAPRYLSTTLVFVLDEDEGMADPAGAAKSVCASTVNLIRLIHKVQAAGNDCKALWKTVEETCSMVVLAIKRPVRPA